MEALLTAKGLWKCTQVLAQDFMTTMGTLTLKEKDEIETKFDKVLGTIQCFLDPTCKEIDQASLTAKDASKTLKDQEGQESYSKIDLLTLLYTTKLEARSLDVDGYVKSMEAIWRRLNDINDKLPEELVVLMTLMGLRPSFGTQGRILESRKDLSMEIVKKNLRQEALRLMEIVKKNLRQEALRLKAEQVQQPQGHVAVNLTRENSRRREREKV
jgi:hypothetical protein